MLYLTMRSIPLGNPQAVFVRGNYAYVTAFIDNALVVLDVSDPTNPTVVGSIVDNDEHVASWIHIDFLFREIMPM